MHETKCELINKHGLRCMLCNREVQLHELQWHHIKPKYASKREGKEPNNTYENGSLLCLSCHSLVHQYDYNEMIYKAFMMIVLYHKNNPSS